MTAKTIFVGEIRAYFNTCRALEALVSYLVILLYTVIVANVKLL